MEIWLNHYTICWYVIFTHVLLIDVVSSETCRITENRDIFRVYYVDSCHCESLACKSNNLWKRRLNIKNAHISKAESRCELFDLPLVSEAWWQYVFKYDRYIFFCFEHLLRLESIHETTESSDDSSLRLLYLYKKNPKRIHKGLSRI